MNKSISGMLLEANSRETKFSLAKDRITELERMVYDNMKTLKAIKGERFTILENEAAAKN